MLTSWRQECLGEAARCWMKVMQFWLMEGEATGYPVTWEGLYDMLEDVQYSEVAKELKKVSISCKKAATF